MNASFMAGAPPPDVNVKTELSQQYNDGIKAEDQALGYAQTQPQSQQDARTQLSGTGVLPPVPTQTTAPAPLSGAAPEPPGNIQSNDERPTLRRRSASVPPPSAQPATPPTIGLGQTKEQIVSIMGRPDKIATVGAKQIYLYKNLKIILTDGKVTDIQ